MEYLMLAAAIFALYWSGKSRNRTNKYAGIILALTVILQFITFLGLNIYAPYAFAFFTLFAGFEAMNSFKFETRHKLFFGYAAIASFICIVEGLIKLPFNLYQEWILLPIPLISYYFWKHSKRVIYHRLGVLVIWSAQAIVALVTAPWMKKLLSEIF
jgi:hypothetical protein